MSQPLSGVVGRKIPIRNERKEYLVNQQNKDAIDWRSLICMVLMIAGVAGVMAGAAILWGVGGMIVALGIVLWLTGVVLGLEG